MSLIRYVLIAPLLFNTPYVLGGSYTLEHSSKFSPSDYLMGSHGKSHDPVFDQPRTIDLNVDLGIGSDCGQIDVKTTLRAALQNLLDAKYLGDMGKDILGASPMLLTCYLSPTWCAILKHFRLKANLLGQLRLNQCSIIDKYVDSRVEDFYQERQTCMHQAIENSGGDMESAMESCQNYWDMDLKDWAGGPFRTQENKLIDSSARWAGLRGRDSSELLSLVKSLVGDTVIKRGKVTVDYGPRRVQLTPLSHLRSLERETFETLCGQILNRVSRSGRNANIDQVITDQDLRSVSGELDNFLIDRQTIRSLAFLPYKKRALSCKKLSDVIALSRHAHTMNRSIDYLTRLLENPHLPDHRRKELDLKRKKLVDQVDMTLTLRKSKDDPLNQVLYQINAEGEKYQSLTLENKLEEDRIHEDTDSFRASFMDCADGIFCE